MTTSPSRYSKQVLFEGIGKDGQQQLNKSKVLLVGCGALGCVVADSLTRAGVGHLRIVDRDYVEMSNLQRQVLFTENDVRTHIPKVIAAEQRLRSINSEITIEAHVANVDFTNIRELAEGVDLILDGTDNFEIRYLINDLSLSQDIPWIFTGCTGSHGQVMPIVPGHSACLRCVMPDPPPAGSTETCDTAGVLGPAIGVVASLQASLALRLLVAKGMNNGAEAFTEKVWQQMTIVDAWGISFRQMKTSGPQPNCPACGEGERRWLSGTASTGSTVLCGRNAVQITPPEKASLNLEELAQKLRPSGEVTANAFLVRVKTCDPELELTVFPDGRAIIKGTEDPAIARAAYSRIIGG